MATFLLIVLCLILIGFFSGIEIAFISTSKLNIELKRKQGTYAGKVLSRFMEEPATFIGTSLVGINITLVLYGLLFSEVTDRLFEIIHLHNEYARLFLDTLLATLVVLVLGEFIPKALFRARSETLLQLLTVPIQFFYYLLYPIARFFVSISEFILKYLFNVRITDHKQVFSRIDLEQFVKQLRTGQDKQEDANTELLENALNLSHIKVRECLIPRNEIEAVPISTSIEDVRTLFLETKLSKILVYEKSIDHVCGYVHHLDFLRSPKEISQVMHQIPTVPETMSVVDLLNQFTRERKSIAWVIDEFGGTAGIVTMEDILEEIFGEIEDEYDVEEYVESQISANEYICSGRLEIDHINQKFQLSLPEDGAETLSGFIIENHESIPKQKEKIIIGDYEFDILAASETRVDMVKIKWLVPKKRKS